MLEMVSNMINLYLVNTGLFGVVVTTIDDHCHLSSVYTIVGHGDTLT